MQDLFNEIRTLDLDDAHIVYHPAPDLGMDADALFQALRTGIAWQQHSVRIHGQLIAQPRLSSWHGEVVHTYSTLAHLLIPAPFDPMLAALRAQVETLAGARFNSMLANLYRDGSDSIGWHSDDEPELGREPVIASISLGAERRFDLRRRDDHTQVARIVLGHGSVLIMRGGTQRHWQHAIARTKADMAERINLTFRLTVPLRKNSFAARERYLA